jgi:hypothetical protein
MRDPDVTVKIYGDALVIDHPNVIKGGTYPKDRSERGDEYDLSNGSHTMQIGEKVVKFIVMDP